MITGVIKNYRMGRHTVYNNQAIVYVKDFTREQLNSLVGKVVIWETPSKKQLRGKVSALHGKKGALRVRFDKGIPGQAIGTQITIKN